MNADLFGDFLDHHRLQLVDAEFQKIALPPHDRLANLQDRLLALLDVLHQLQRRGVLLLDVIANFLTRLLIPVEHAPVLRVQSELRNVLVVQLNDVVVAVFGDVDIGLDRRGRPRPRSAGRAADPGAG